MGQKVNIPQQNQPFRRQAGLGGNVSFRNLNGTQDNSFVTMAKVTKVYYKQGKIDFKLTNTVSMVEEQGGNGSGSAPIPVDFFGRRPNGEVFGHYRPIKIGDLVAIAYVDGRINEPIVVGVYPNSAQDYEIVSPSMYETGDDNNSSVNNSALAEQKIYPSMQLDYRSGSGTIARALNGHSFLVVDDETSHQYNLLWQNYDTVGFFHNAGDAIEPLKEKAGDWLLVHEDNPLADGADNHRTRFFVSKTGDVQVVLMDNTSSGNIAVITGNKDHGFSIKQYYGLGRVKSGDLGDNVYEPDFQSAANYVSLDIGQDQEIALQAVADKATKLEVKPDGLYLNGKPLGDALNVDNITKTIEDNIGKDFPSNGDLDNIKGDLGKQIKAVADEIGKATQEAQQASDDAKQAGEDAKQAGLAAEQAGQDAKNTGDDIKKNVIYYANRYKGLHPGLHLDGGMVAITGDSYIENSVINSAMIENGAIDQAKIANGAIGTAQIANAAINKAQIANEAVGTDQIEDAAITDAKVGNLSFKHMAGHTLDAGQIKVINLTADSIKAHTITADNLDISKLSNITPNAGDINKGHITANDDPNKGVKIDNLDADNPEKYTPTKKYLLLTELGRLNAAAEATIDYAKSTGNDYSAVQKAKDTLDNALAGLLSDLTETSDVSSFTVTLADGKQTTLTPQIIADLEKALQEAISAFQTNTNADIIAKIGTTADGKNSIYRGANEPQSPNENDIWFKINSDGTYAIEVWDGARWINPSLEEVEQINANLSQLPKSYYQADMPVGASVHKGDTWYKPTLFGKKYYYVVYKYDGSNWQSISASADAETRQALSDLQNDANTLTQTVTNNKTDADTRLNQLKTALAQTSTDLKNLDSTVQGQAKTEGQDKQDILNRLAGVVSDNQDLVKQVNQVKADNANQVKTINQSIQKNAQDIAGLVDQIKNVNLSSFWKTQGGSLNLNDLTMTSDIYFDGTSITNSPISGNQYIEVVQQADQVTQSVWSTSDTTEYRRLGHKASGAWVFGNWEAYAKQSTLEDYVNGQVSQVKQSAQKNSSAIADIRGNINTLTQTSQTTESTLSNVQKGFNDLKQTVSGNTETIKDTQNSVNQIKTTAQGLQESITNQSKDIDTNKTNIASLQTDVNGIHTNFNSYQETVASDISNAQSAAQSNANKYADSAVNGVGNIASSAQMTANAAQSAASQATDNASKASSEATQAANTANSANVTANSANVTANSANVTANSAQSAANSNAGQITGLQKQYTTLNNSFNVTNQGMKDNATKISKIGDQLNATNAQLKLNSGQFQTEVEGISANLSRMNIGGDNLLTDTDHMTVTNGNQVGTLSLAELNTLRGQTVTVSVDVQWFGFSNSNDSLNRLGWSISSQYQDNNQTKTFVMGAWKYPASARGFDRVSATFTVPDFNFTQTDGGKAYIQMNATQGQVGHPQLQLGDKATAWQVASKDINQSFSDVRTSINETQDTITLTAEKIGQQIAQIKVKPDDIASMITNNDGNVGSIIDQRINSLKDLVKVGQSYSGFEIDSGGVTFTGGTSVMSLSSDGFILSSTKKGNSSSLYVDNGGNVTLSGNLTAADIIGADSTLSGNLVVNGGHIEVGSGPNNPKVDITTEGNYPGIHFTEPQSKGANVTNNGGFFATDSGGHLTTYLKSDGTLFAHQADIAGSIDANSLNLNNTGGDGGQVSINVGGKFTVGNDGKVTATDIALTGSLQGNINNQNGTIIGGVITGGTITGNKINGGTIEGSHIIGNEFESLSKVNQIKTTGSMPLVPGYSYRDILNRQKDSTVRLPTFSMSSDGTQKFAQAMFSLFTNTTNTFNYSDGTTETQNIVVYHSTMNTKDTISNPLTYDGEKIDVSRIIANSMDGYSFMFPLDTMGVHVFLPLIKIENSGSIKPLRSLTIDYALAFPDLVVNDWNQIQDVSLIAWDCDKADNQVYTQVLQNSGESGENGYEAITGSQNTSQTYNTWDLEEDPNYKPFSSMHHVFFSGITEYTDTIDMRSFKNAKNIAIGLKVDLKGQTGKNIMVDFYGRSMNIISDMGTNNYMTINDNLDTTMQSTVVAPDGGIFQDSYGKNYRDMVGDGNYISSTSETGQHRYVSMNGGILTVQGPSASDGPGSLQSVLSGEGLCFSEGTNGTGQARLAFMGSGVGDIPPSESNIEGNGSWYDNYGNMHAMTGSATWNIVGTSNSNVFTVNFQNGAVGAKSWQTWSQLSKKTNITPVSQEKAFNNIMNTNEFNYQYKTDKKRGSDKYYASVIIDDVHKKPQKKYHVPEQFIGEDKDKRDDGTQLAYLTSAFQYYVNKTTKQINKLINQIKELKNNGTNSN